MQLALIFSALLIGVHGQLSATRDQECKENESFQSCGTACEPSCENQNPSFCTIQCVIGCQCDKGFYRNSENKCVSQSDCNAAPSSSPIPLILPAPSTNLTCDTNEEANECHNSCTERKCPSKFAPLVNCLMACQNGCSCKTGHMRNMKGQCVKEADCPSIGNSTEDQCNLIDCQSGTKCMVLDDVPTCIPVRNTTPSPEDPPQRITCANVRCGTKGGCGMVEPLGCLQCRRQPHCLNVNGCHTANCSSNEECVLVQAICFRAPCDPIAECRPKAPKVPRPLVQIREQRQSAPSCMTARCATPAGCAMIKPMSCGNAQDCQLIPACIHHNACAATTCPFGSQCVLHKATCIRAPCNPIARCEPNWLTTQAARPTRKCAKNERYLECKSPCSDVKCNASTAKMCTAVCVGSGCVCQEGYFRDTSGNCVTKDDCDAQKV